jgi:hypothetical protein
VRRGSGTHPAACSGAPNSRSSRSSRSSRRPPQVNLKNRMPELVDTFTWKKNISLADRADVNGGCQYVVIARLFSDDPAALAAYLSHPQHKEVGVLQNPMLEGRFVVDVVVE